MGLRTILLGIGIVEALFPRQFVDYWMDLVVDAPDEPITLKPWIYTAARIEGILIVLWVLSKRVGGDN